MKVTYELHVKSKDRWTIDQTFPGDAKEEAIDYAKRQYAEPHVSAVKVIAETYNEQTNQSSEVTVFEAAPGPRPGAEPAKPKRQAASPKAKPAKPAAGQGGVARPQKKAPEGMSTTKLAVLAVGGLALAAVLGVVVMRGAETLSGMG
ncbi:MAG: hypothetical protein QGF53_08835 [Alphaproteobacteria bacterium]|jgi:hypothetical protein|nr:hypothetical protein [Alphaproteobacteria bacterium]